MVIQSATRVTGNLPSRSKERLMPVVSTRAQDVGTLEKTKNDLTVEKS